MSKTLYLISNAHLDPVWQWEWEEGAAQALSTFRCAADFCEEFEGYVFNHNEALLYRWVEEYEPALFERIRRLVKEGKWHIMGGWHLQPDCNLPSGEAFVRQILSGRVYFKEKFGVEPTTAINFDPFGHTRGLVQILAKSGFDSYLFCRPGEEKIHLPDGPFRWVGYDGSTVMGQRLPDYGSALGKATEKIQGTLAGRSAALPFDACLWGVGDHGGGPSRKDLTAIAELKKELAKKDILLLHSTPEEFFARMKSEGAVLPEHAGDLNPWAPGCYTSQVRIKQKYRQIENTLFETEKMVSAAGECGMPWPTADFDAVAYDMLTAQFHDFLPGSSIQPVEEMALRTLDHGLEILSRIRARAFFALSRSQPAAAEGEIPVLIYNPHPYPVEGDFECEMMLWDQNWDGDFSMPHISRDGRPLPTQCEKEASNIPLDWRKRAVFHAVLNPMQMNRFACTYTRVPQKPVPSMKENETHWLFETACMSASVSKATGLLDSYVVGGVPLLETDAFALDVIADNADPWGMTVTSFEKGIGSFRRMSSEEATAFCGVDAPIEPVHVIEDGDVRTVVESLLCYGASRAAVRYTFSKSSAEIGVEVRVEWAEIHKMLKLRLPSVLDEPACLGQTAFGEEMLPMTGRENLAQKYAVLTDGEHALSVLNDGSYGLSGKENTLWLTLLRSPAYTAHPIEDRKIIPQDRYTPHIEQGERLFHFVLRGGRAETVRADVGRLADAFNEKPMALSFFPAGGAEQTDTPAGSLLEISGETVQMAALKTAEDGDGRILRLFNPTGKEQTTVLSGRLLAKPLPVTMGRFEIITLRLKNGTATPCDLMEKEL